MEYVLKKVFSHLPHLPYTLKTPVLEGGSNFSVGERQLLCLARAILRGGKILILDEATSAVDSSTDARIQNIVREEFKDCTVFSIAHRLSTIADFDRIMVLSDGNLAELGTVEELICYGDGNPTIFSQMVEEANEMDLFLRVIRKKKSTSSSPSLLMEKKLIMKKDEEIEGEMMIELDDV